MNPRDNIRAAVRTLQVLRALNRRPAATFRQLQRDTGLTGPTLARILGTLENLGYVFNAGRHAGWVPTGQVAELSAGWHGFPAIRGPAAAVLEDLTRRLLWPAALATLDGGAMTVRISTIPISPLAHTHSTLGRRLDLAATAHGRACLAFSPAEERRRLLALLAGNAGAAAHGRETEWRDGDGQDRDRRDRDRAARLRQMLVLTRKRGYALRDSRAEPPLDPAADPAMHLPADPGTITVAVPVMRSGMRGAPEGGVPETGVPETGLFERGVVATIGITCFSGARADPDLLARELRAAAARIEAAGFDTEGIEAAGVGAPDGPGAAETGAAETGSAETGSAKTGAAKTGAAKTGAAETGAAEIGAAGIGAGQIAPQDGRT